MLGGSLSTKVSLQVRCWNPGTGVPAGGYLGRKPRYPLQKELGWCKHRGSGWAWSSCGAAGQSQCLKERPVLPCQQDDVCLWHDLTSPVPVGKHPREQPDSPVTVRALFLQSLQHAEVPWLWQLQPWRVERGLGC